MFECPNCGGNLKFDIKSQKMLCGYCNSDFDPYEIKKENEAKEGNDFDVTVFTCPQCNGEIYSTDNTAAGFCIFCGASNVLNTRLQNEKRPGYIIPFQKTKEDCKELYTKLMKYAFFAPNELKSPKHIDGFKGIYMPYWVFHVVQQGLSAIRGSTSTRRGDYIVTRHYILNMNMDNYYKGLSYDASSSFSDNISEKLAPFDVKNMKEFTPAFLSGFYADIADVDSAVYESDAREVATRKTKKYLKKSTRVGDYKMETPEDELEDIFGTKVIHTDTAMFPVWFLSYRNKNRVAYATVNGQTGKVVADLPVDIKKYVLGSIVLAVPIAILLNLFLTIRPSVLLTIVSFLGAVTLFLYCREMKQIAVREGYEDDKGMMEALREQKEKRKQKREQAMREAAAALGDDVPEAYVVKQEAINKNRKVKKKRRRDILPVVIFSVVFLCIVLMSFASVLSALGIHLHMFVAAAVLIAALVMGAMGMGHVKKLKEKKGFGVLWGLLSTIVATMIILWNPVSDLYYYAGVIFCMAAVLVTLIDLILSYNVLATRKLPQFDYKGGDDRA